MMSDNQSSWSQVHVTAILGTKEFLLLTLMHAAGGVYDFQYFEDV